MASEGSVLVPDGRRTVWEVALASDVVVSLGYNSGGLVTGMAGARSVFWEPAPRGHGPFAEWFQGIGWEDPSLVFPTMQKLLEGLEAYLQDPARNDSFGDLSARTRDLDPCADGLAGKRLALFTRVFLDSLEGGQDRTAALRTAVDRYRSEWGDDAILETDSYERRSQRIGAKAV